MVGFEGFWVFLVVSVYLRGLEVEFIVSLVGVVFLGGFSFLKGFVNLVIYLVGLVFGFVGRVVYFVILVFLVGFFCSFVGLVRSIYSSGKFFRRFC